MPRITLNDRKIVSLKPGKVRRDYFDRSLPGFGIRVGTHGTKSFIYMYRDANRRFVRKTIGPYLAPWTLHDARVEARRLLEGTSEGRDMAAEAKDAQTQTWSALCDLYLERHAKQKKRSWRADARMIRQELDGWRNRPVSKIHRRDVRELLDAIVDRGAPILANRVLALVRKILNFGIDREWVEANVAAKMARPAAEKSRSRVLTDDELRAVLAYLDEAPPEKIKAIDGKHWTLNRAALKLRLLTAQRGREVVTMRWRDIDGNVWTIPEEIAKNKKPHRVPLTAPALEVLQSLRVPDAVPQKSAKPVRVRSTGSKSDPIKTDSGGPETEAKDFLFAGIRGTRQRRGALEGLELKDVRPHDFRRTAATRMAEAGIARLVIAKVLNHTEKGVTAVYDRHSYDPEKRVALETWARTLKTIAKGKKKGAAVVPIRGRA